MHTGTSTASSSDGVFDAAAAGAIIFPAATALEREHVVARERFAELKAL